MEDLAARYPATASTSIEDRQRTLRLLADDLAGMSPVAAERAVKLWVQRSAFMPKASDIIALARNLGEGEVGTVGKRLDVASIRNAQMDVEPGARQDIRWVDDGLGLRLVPMAEYRRMKRALPAIPEQRGDEQAEAVG